MDIVLSFTGRERRSDLSALNARSADHLEIVSKKSVVSSSVFVLRSQSGDTNNEEENKADGGKPPKVLEPTLRF